MTPKISICIPTFNRSDLLDKALRSVSMQTVKPYEVIVVDNASTDDTKDVVKKYKKFGVKYIKNKKNVGMVNNWNVCIEKSRGDYLTLLHNDDVIAPDWHEVMSQAVTEHPKVKFFMSSLLIINDKEEVLHIYHTFPYSQLIKKENSFKEFWTHLLPGFAPTAANLYHRSVFKKIGMFEDTFKTEADVVSSIKILSHFDVFYIKKAIFAYRSHANQGFDLVQQKKSLDEEIKRKANHYHIIKHFYEKLFHSNPRERFFIQYPVFMTLAAISLFLIKFDFEKVRLHFRLAKQYFPDLFSVTSDILIYLKLLTIFIKRYTLDKLNNTDHQNDYNWLKRI